MHKIVSSLLSLVLIVAAILIASAVIKNKNKTKPKVNKVVKTAFVKKVENGEVPIKLSSTGTLIAKSKMDIYSEVQGVLRPADKLFKPGVSYAKGEDLLRIEDLEFDANLRAQKSLLINALTAIMPDIKMDYTDELEKWKNYLDNLNIHREVGQLPEFSTDKERYFISGKGLVQTYYQVKNMEAKQRKYRIKAPYNGVITETFLNHGALVRLGQKLGEFIDPSVYEMEVSVPAAYASWLKEGVEVEMKNVETEQVYKGKLVRINGKVNTSSQMIQVYVETSSAELREGMYLEARFNAKRIPNATTISRNLLVGNQYLYLVRDTILKLHKIEPVYHYDDVLVVKGLNEGDFILSKPMAGAYEGMNVKIEIEE